MSIKYIKGFEAIRAIGIILVFSNHLGIAHILPNNVFFKQRVHLLFSGTTGLAAFFVVSGFLITTILLNEKSNTGKINFRNFYIRRVLRLAPAAIILYTTLSILMITGILEQNYLGIVMAATCTFNFAPLHNMTAELGHVWSLSLEEQFYVILPFILVHTRNYKKLLLLLLVIFILCQIINYNLGHLPFIDTYEFYRNGNIYIIGKLFSVRHWFIPHVDQILIGCAFAITVHLNSDKMKSLFQNTKKPLFLALIFHCSPLFLPLSIFPVFYTTQAVGAMLVMGWLYYNQHHKVCDILEFKPLKYLGQITYGLYLYHGIFIRTGPGGSLWIQHPPINIILTLLAAILSFELIEKPILQLKKRFR